MFDLGNKKLIRLLGVASAGILSLSLMLTPTQAEIVLEKEVEIEVEKKKNGKLEVEIEREREIEIEKKGKKRKVEIESESETEIEGSLLPTSTLAPAQMSSQTSAQSSTEASTEAEKMSRGEMLRRQRMREEIRNEDALQERLETIRLQAEQKRTDKINQFGEDKAPEAENAKMTEEKVVAPITERPGQVKDQVIVTQSSVNAQGTATDAQGAVSTSMSAPQSEFGGTFIGIQPRFGISSMTSDTGGFKLDSKYTAGVSITADIAEHASLDFGYQYGEYGLKYNKGQDFMLWASQYHPQYYDYAQNHHTHSVKQNVFDLGARVHLFPRDSRFRPFLAAGGGYARTYLNYEKRYLDFARRSGLGADYTNDYELSQVLGYLGGGLDVKLSKHISIGMLLKYYKVLSSSENSQVNHAAIYYGYYGYMPPSSKNYLGGSLADSDFFTATAGITFHF